MTELAGEIFHCSRDAFLPGHGRPLYRNGRLLPYSYEPFGKWEPEVPLAPPEQIVTDPVIYLCHPFSANYNIFLHETLPCVAALSTLPPEVKVYVRNDAFRLDFLRRLGVPPERIVLASGRPTLLRYVLHPLRRLNLKYLGPKLFKTYDRITASLRAESAPARKGLVYLDRKKAKINTGANRFILNDEEVSAALAAAGARQVYLEDSNLAQKYDILSNSGTVVTPIGANLVNVALAENIGRIILICSPAWGHFAHYWRCLLQRRHPAARIIMFRDCVVEDNGLSADPFNKPYRVDATALRRVLDNAAG